MPDFAQQLIHWQKSSGRHDLPWQHNRDPYRIWLSEIMLQQTQVGTVIPYYQRFLQRLPTLAELAAAPLDTVLALWSGLGYYSRARNLHSAAQRVVAQHQGVFPQRIEDIAALPGIGRSTAAAIAVFAFGAQRAILDGNVKRVLARHFGVTGYTGETITQAELWRLAEALLPAQEVEIYTQALMDFGATLCTRARPACTDCPLSTSCMALATDRVALLPTPRPKKNMPQRHTKMLIMHHNGNIFLEQRPPSGIWGGLWSLPEISPDTDINAHCRHRFGVEIGASGNLPAVKHSFTHFCLHIQPQLLEVIRTVPRMTEAGQVWLTPETALSGAIPAPVRKLLCQLTDF